MSCPVVYNDWKGEPAEAFFKDALDISYTTLGYANGPSYLRLSETQSEGFKVFPHSHHCEIEANTGEIPNIVGAYGLTTGLNDSEALMNCL